MVEDGGEVGFGEPAMHRGVAEGHFRSKTLTTVQLLMRGSSPRFSNADEDDLGPRTRDHVREGANYYREPAGNPGCRW